MCLNCVFRLEFVRSFLLLSAVGVRCGKFYDFA
uniref:Uncharacterized protein n=1 Tax=Rhizophora mucronata TaxID=61149 RepID=A0A2P2PKW6_RHIMU